MLLGDVETDQQERDHCQNNRARKLEVCCVAARREITTKQHDGGVQLRWWSCAVVLELKRGQAEEMKRNDGFNHTK